MADLRRVIEKDGQQLVQHRDRPEASWYTISEYPKKVDGRTVWACCVSTIGPPCQHRTLTDRDLEGHEKPAGVWWHLIPAR